MTADTRVALKRAVDLVVREDTSVLGYRSPSGTMHMGIPGWPATQCGISVTHPLGGIRRGWHAAYAPSTCLNCDR